MIRLTEPVIEQDDLDAVQAVLKSGYLVQGANVDELESRLCEITGSAYAVAVSSGTAALHIGLLSLGI